MKETLQSVGLRQATKEVERRQELAAAAGLAVTGHPGAAMMVGGASPLKDALGKGARLTNDAVLAPLQEAAAKGAPWAVLARMATEQGIPLSTAQALLARRSQPVPPPQPQMPGQLTSTAIFPTGIAQ